MLKNLHRFGLKRYAKIYTNILQKMLLKVIENKVNFAKNKKISLFASRISKKINERI